jgi:hypothetical protein
MCIYKVAPMAMSAQRTGTVRKRMHSQSFRNEQTSSDWSRRALLIRSEDTGQLCTVSREPLLIRRPLAEAARITRNDCFSVEGSWHF